MRLTDRLQRYLDHKGITVYSFERTCDVGNGYLGKQSKGKGSIGSDILEKIADNYPDLNLTWLITGRGKMLQKTVAEKESPAGTGHLLREEEAVYKIRNKLIEVLKDQLKTLESPVPVRKSRKKQSSRKTSGKKA